VVRVKDEQHLECADEDRVSLVFRLGHSSDHREEILDVAQVVVGIYERQSLQMAIAERGDCRDFGEEPDDGDVPFTLVEDIPRAGIE